MELPNAAKLPAKLSTDPLFATIHMLAKTPLASSDQPWVTLLQHSVEPFATVLVMAGPGG